MAVAVPYDPFEFKNKVVLITGSSSGLGQNAAVDFARWGAKVSLTGRNEDGLNITEQLCLDVGLPKHHIAKITGDLTEAGTCKKIVDHTVKTFGRIDILINNAGIVRAGTFENCPMKDLDDCLNVNMRCMFMMTKAALPFIMGSKGNIVNVSSFTAVRPVNDYIAYCLSKTAVDQFTRSLALELGNVGVRVNSVNPGIMRDTWLWIRPGLHLYKNPIVGGFVLKKIGSMYPLLRPSLSTEVAPAILFLASEKMSSFTTGVNLLVDGGKAQTSET